MHNTVQTFGTMADLRNHIRKTLCDHDRLDPKQATMREGRIVRCGKTCGAMFQIRGPRLLRTYAIWAGEEHRILYYESTGTRFAESKLTESPNFDELEPAA